MTFQPVLEKIYASQVKVFRSYANETQGWVSVKRLLIEELGILDKLSSESREHGHTIYVDDRDDKQIFVDELKRRHIGFRIEPPLNFSNKNIGKYTPILRNVEIVLRGTTLFANDWNIGNLRKIHCHYLPVGFQYRLKLDIIGHKTEWFGADEYNKIKERIKEIIKNKS